MDTKTEARMDDQLARERRGWRRQLVIAGVIALIVLASGYYTGLFDVARLGAGLPAMWQLFT